MSWYYNTKLRTYSDKVDKNGNLIAGTDKFNVDGYMREYNLINRKIDQLIDKYKANTKLKKLDDVDEIQLFIELTNCYKRFKKYTENKSTNIKFNGGKMEYGASDFVLKIKQGEIKKYGCCGHLNVIAGIEFGLMNKHYVLLKIYYWALIKFVNKINVIDELKHYKIKIIYDDKSLGNNKVMIGWDV